MCCSVLQSFAPAIRILPIQPQRKIIIFEEKCFYQKAVRPVLQPLRHLSLQHFNLQKKNQKGGISVICHVTRVQKMYSSIYTHMHLRTRTSACCICTYGVATISRTLEIVGLFCNRALQKRLYPAKETYNTKDPTNHSYSICANAAGRGVCT